MRSVYDTLWAENESFGGSGPAWRGNSVLFGNVFAKLQTALDKVSANTASNERYRKRFKSCHRQYSLAVPFMEQLFRLAMRSSIERPVDTDGTKLPRNTASKDLGPRTRRRRA